MEAGPSGGDTHGSNDRNTPETVVEIKIKTLDSHIYTCQVERDMPVPVLKEKIASLTGIPAENQRLICRGKVLKDDHLLSTYGVEDGHTLHLVTHQVPPANATTSTGDPRNEGQGHTDVEPSTSRGRTGQISHSVVLGTFNIPDHVDGGMPDVSRIISSVLNSLGINNLVPATAGVNNNGSASATVLPGQVPHRSENDDLSRIDIGSDRHQIGVNIPSSASSLHQNGPRELDASINSIHPNGGFVGVIPPVPQIPLVQQAMVVPDALATLSQYLTRIEQVFAVNAHHPVSSTSTQPSGALTRTTTGDQTYPSPEILGAIIRHTQELLSNRTAPELARLASMLENNVSFCDAAARDEVQHTALRDGMMMQHMGALLLELGRTILTLRMGLLPAESIVNAGPAVFISATGPNPMMVQPLPFPATSLTPQTTVGTLRPPTVVADTPRNINIHIHAGELGSPASLVAVSEAPPVVPVPEQTSVLQGPSLMSDMETDAVSRSSSGTHASSFQISSGSLQSVPVGIPERGAVRVLPMRALVAALPAGLHMLPPTDTSGTAVGAFYPLLARFQQLNPAQLSQQTAFISGVPVGPSIPSVFTQQPSPTSVPTVRTQVQVQAWVPSGSQVIDGQNVSRPISRQGTMQLPVLASASEVSSMVQQQQSHMDMPVPVVHEQNLVQEQPNYQETAGVNMAETVASGRVDVSHATLGDGIQRREMTSGIDITGLSQSALEVQEAHQQAGVGSKQLEVPGSNKRVSHNEMDNDWKPNQKRTNNIQDVVSVKHDSHADSISGGGIKVKCTPVQSVSDLAASSNSEEFLKVIGSSDAQENNSGHFPVSLGRMQPLPPETGASGFVSGDATKQLMHKEDDQDAMGSRSQKNFHDAFGSSSSQSDDTNCLRGQMHFNSITTNIPTTGDNIENIGEVASHLMGNQSEGSVSQVARTATNEALPLPSSSDTGMMTQLVQNPFTRNMLQQGTEKILDEPQGNLDFSSLFQQVLPVVSRAALRTGGSVMDPTGNPGNTGDQQTLHDDEATKDVARANFSQDELALLNETISSEQQQPTQEMSDNELCPGNAPVTKRQKTQ